MFSHRSLGAILGWSHGQSASRASQQAGRGLCGGNCPARVGGSLVCGACLLLALTTSLPNRSTLALNKLVSLYDADVDGDADGRDSAEGKNSDADAASLEIRVYRTSVKLFPRCRCPFRSSRVVNRCAAGWMWCTRLVSRDPLCRRPVRPALVHMMMVVVSCV